MDENIMNGLL